MKNKITSLSLMVNVTVKKKWVVNRNQFINNLIPNMKNAPETSSTATRPRIK